MSETEHFCAVKGPVEPNMERQHVCVAWSPKEGNVVENVLLFLFFRALQTFWGLKKTPTRTLFFMFVSVILNTSFHQYLPVSESCWSWALPAGSCRNNYNMSSPLHFSLHFPREPGICKLLAEAAVERRRWQHGSLIEVELFYLVNWRLEVVKGLIRGRLWLLGQTHFLHTALLSGSGNSRCCWRCGWRCFALIFTVNVNRILNEYMRWLD